jgi:hypothetical protein
MSNPTSNFGWQMPTSTDLVTDLPADFEVFGQAVDTALMDLKGGTTGQVLKKNTNTDMDFVWSADAAGMTNPMTTTGDTIYSSSGSTPARLGIGSTGQVLTVAGGVPSWATPAGGGGKVLQVVSAVTAATEIQNATSTYADTNVTATITPTSATSKILVMVGHHHIFKMSTNAASGVTMRLMRGATELIDAQNILYTGTAIQNHGALTFVYMDSPATTSATTYKTQFNNNANASYVSVQCDGDVSTIILMEIGA